MRSGNSLPTQPFDSIAEDYDTQFSQHPLGKRLRAITWKYLEEAFSPGDHVLELGCGSGEDALWLAKRGVRVTATDASLGMLTVANRKATIQGLADRITFAQLDLNEINYDLKLLPTGTDAKFDGAFSNFGALNCVADMQPVANVLTQWIRPGGQVILVLMSPVCPWEIFWYLAHRQPRMAFRRWRGGEFAKLGEDARVQIWYPSQRRLHTSFAPEFQPKKSAGVGVFLPPTEFGHMLEKYPRLFRFLNRLERRFGKFPLFAWMNDHYLSVLERR
jgi:ubiquinone/menaquinone biosynthesis C-methylase UbiE